MLAFPGYGQNIAPVGVVYLQNQNTFMTPLDGFGVDFPVALQELKSVKIDYDQHNYWDLNAQRTMVTLQREMDAINKDRSSLLAAGHNVDKVYSALSKTKDIYRSVQLTKGDANKQKIYNSANDKYYNAIRKELAAMKLKPFAKLMLI